VNLSLVAGAAVLAASTTSVEGPSLDGVPFKDVPSATLRQVLAGETTSDTLRYAIEQELLLRENEYRRALRDYDERQFRYRDPGTPMSDHE
jgi:hypothetical protein